MYCVCGHAEDEHSMTGECQVTGCLCGGYQVGYTGMEAYHAGYNDAIADFRNLIKEEHTGPTDVILKGFVGTLMKSLAVLEESARMTFAEKHGYASDSGVVAVDDEQPAG